MKLKVIEQTVHRSAETGHFVTRAYAEKHKATTVKQRVHVPHAKNKNVKRNKETGCFVSKKKRR